MKSRSFLFSFFQYSFLLQFLFYFYIISHKLSITTHQNQVNSSYCITVGEENRQDAKKKNTFADSAVGRIVICFLFCFLRFGLCINHHRFFSLRFLSLYQIITSFTKDTFAGKTSKANGCRLICFLFLFIHMCLLHTPHKNTQIKPATPPHKVSCDKESGVENRSRC